jgi:hypothetical protein
MKPFWFNKFPMVVPQEPPKINNPLAHLALPPRAFHKSLIMAFPEAAPINNIYIFFFNGLCLSNGELWEVQ